MPSLSSLGLYQRTCGVFLYKWLCQPNFVCVYLIIVCPIHCGFHTTGRLTWMSNLILRFRTYFRRALCCPDPVHGHHGLSRYSGRFSQYSGFHRSSFVHLNSQTILMTSPMTNRVVLTRSSLRRGEDVYSWRSELHVPANHDQEAETAFMWNKWWRTGVRVTAATSGWFDSWNIQLAVKVVLKYLTWFLC